MSRRGGGGRGRGRGGFGGGGALPPMGLTFADLQSLSREATAMYPPMRPPVLSEYSEQEKKACRYQLDLIARLHKSQYYVVEHKKSTELPRYSDKYKPSRSKQPKLKRDDLHAPFFPTEIFETYFNPRKKRKGRSCDLQAPKKKSVNVDELNEDEEEPDKEGEAAASEAGSGEEQDDYDVDEEYDNDYAENYFDNGEGDDMDDIGGDDGGGGGDYD